LEAHTPDIEILLEPIGLEEIGQLEGADIAAALAHFALEVANHPPEVLGAEACSQPFIPRSLAVKAQAQALTGELAVEVMQGQDLLRANGG
jgi:hypothetical protein